MPKETREVKNDKPKETNEVIAAKIQTRGNIISAFIGAIAVLVVGLVTAFFAFPPFQEFIQSWGRTGESQPLAIEEIQQRTFAYAGNDNPDGGGGSFVLIVDQEKILNYRLEYSLPGDRFGYAGLAFTFPGSMNLSAYGAIEYIITFSGPHDEIDLNIKDIAGHSNTIRVVGSGVEEMVLRHEFKNFPDINFNAVKEVGFVAETVFSTGAHQIIVKQIRFTE